MVIEQSAAGTKRRRITQACDFCHQRRIRCRPAAPDDGSSCQNCFDFGHPCTFNRDQRPRGGRRHEPPIASSGHLPAGSYLDTVEPQSLLTIQTKKIVDNFSAPHVAEHTKVVDLVELYFEVVYPVFPFFHQPSFSLRVAQSEYQTNKALFAATMAICALVSGRIRDGAVTNPRWGLSSLSEPNPDVFYKAASRELENLKQSSELNLLRAHAIMAISAIQNGNIRDMHYHLGIHHTIVAMDGLHDEGNWPMNMDIIEREERRRLFWSIYTLDIYTALVWGGMIRSREQQANVEYPLEVDDDFINKDNATQQTPDTANPIISRPGRRQSGRRLGSEQWMTGWNFVTDMYRILEHALVRLRGNQSGTTRPSFLQGLFQDPLRIDESAIDARILQLYAELPVCFKETPTMSYDVRKDRFGFQAANITASLQLLRMVLLAAAQADISDRCRVADEVVNAFLAVPAPYLLAIGTPLLHHLGGIGATLGSVFDKPLCEVDYSNLRSAMLSMARLLETMEATHRQHSASADIRVRVERIDQYMSVQRESTNASIRPGDPTTLSNIISSGQVTMDGEGYPDGNSVQDILFQIPSDILEDFSWGLDSIQLWP